MAAVHPPLHCYSSYFLQWVCRCLPSKCPFPLGYLVSHLILDSMGPHEPASQTAACRLAQPFLHALHLCAQRMHGHYRTFTAFTCHGVLYLNLSTLSRIADFSKSNQIAKRLGSNQIVNRQSEFLDWVKSRFKRNHSLDLPITRYGSVF